MYVIISLLLISLSQIFGRSVPFIQNAFLQPSINSSLNITVRSNISCEECLCQELFSNNYLLVNCLANQTCQFFSTFPLTYKIKSSNGSRVYFLQNQFPNASQCCMPNITDLLIRLKYNTPTTINLAFRPGSFGYDNANPFEAAVAGFGAPFLYWFNPITTASLRNFTIPAGSYSLTVYKNQTFTAVSGTSSINIRDSQTNNYLGNISHTSLSQVRKLVFIDNDQTLIVPTQSSYSLTIFKINSSNKYIFQQEIPFPLSAAHGIAKVNDTLLYVSAWTSRSILAYRHENFTWTYKVLVNTTATADGSFLEVDECGRIWFINTQFGLRIYDPSGIEIGNWNMSLGSSNTIYDIVFLPNYVLYVSYVQQQKIVRYDPQVTCG